MKQKLLTLSVLSAMSFSSLAADSEAEVKTWDISSEAGAIITSGNTKTTTLKGGIKVKHNLQSWHNEYKLDGIYKEDEVTQEKEAPQPQKWRPTSLRREMNNLDTFYNPKPMETLAVLEGTIRMSMK